jgi:hypothetical protein
LVNLTIYLKNISKLRLTNLPLPPPLAREGDKKEEGASPLFKTPCVYTSFQRECISERGTSPSQVSSPSPARYNNGLSK